MDQNLDHYLTLYLGWQAPGPLLATFYTVLALLLFAYIIGELLLRYKQTQKTIELEALFGMSGSSAALENRRSGGNFYSAKNIGRKASRSNENFLAPSRRNSDSTRSLEAIHPNAAGASRERLLI